MYIPQFFIMRQCLLNILVTPNHKKKLIKLDTLLKGIPFFIHFFKRGNNQTKTDSGVLTIQCNPSYSLLISQN